MIILDLHVGEKFMCLNICELKGDSAFTGYCEVVYLHQVNNH